MAAQMIQKCDYVIRNGKCFLRQIKNRKELVFFKAVSSDHTLRVGDYLKCEPENCPIEKRREKQDRILKTVEKIEQAIRRNGKREAKRKLYLKRA